MPDKLVCTGEIFGHLYLNIYFRKLFQLSDTGIHFKNKKYLWNDIQKVENSFGAFFFNLFMYSRGCPGATICFNDGNKIKINGRIFIKKGEPNKFDMFGFVTAKSKTFSDFLDLLTKKTMKGGHTKPESKLTHKGVGKGYDRR